MPELMVGGECGRWRRYVSSSVLGLLTIVRSPDWERVQVNVVLPSFMFAEGGLKLARCLRIWGAVTTGHPTRGTWVFDTDCGTFADPEFNLELRAVQQQSLYWKDCEDDWDETGSLKL